MTLQQEAAGRLGFTIRRTMELAQALYEGIELGTVNEGLITYMRTDSVALSTTALASARRALRGMFAPEYLRAKPRLFRARRAGVQEAHEAIRPTDFARTPELLAGRLEGDAARRCKRSAHWSARRSCAPSRRRLRGSSSGRARTWHGGAARRAGPARSGCGPAGAACSSVAGAGPRAATAARSRPPPAMTATPGRSRSATIRPPALRSRCAAVRTAGTCSGTTAPPARKPSACRCRAQDGVEVEARADAQDRGAERRDALAQRRVLPLDRVESAHGSVLSCPGRIGRPGPPDAPAPGRIRARTGARRTDLAQST